MMGQQWTIILHEIILQINARELKQGPQAAKRGMASIL